MKRDGIDREKNDRDINIAKLKGSDLINDIKKEKCWQSNIFQSTKSILIPRSRRCGGHFFPLRVLS